MSSEGWYFRVSPSASNQSRLRRFVYFLNSKLNGLSGSLLGGATLRAGGGGHAAEGNASLQAKGGDQSASCSHTLQYRLKKNGRTHS